MEVRLRTTLHQSPCLRVPPLSPCCRRQTPATNYHECQPITCDFLALGVWGNAPQKLCFGGKMRKHPRAPAPNPLRALCLSAPLREIFPPNSISKSLPHHSVSLCLCVSSSRYPTTNYQPPTTNYRETCSLFTITYSLRFAREGSHWWNGSGGATEYLVNYSPSDHLRQTI